MDKTQADYSGRIEGTNRHQEESWSLQTSWLLWHFCLPWGSSTPLQVYCCKRTHLTLEDVVLEHSDHPSLDHHLSQHWFFPYIFLRPYIIWIISGSCSSPSCYCKGNRAILSGGNNSRKLDIIQFQSLPFPSNGAENIGSSIPAIDRGSGV